MASNWAARNLTLAVSWQSGGTSEMPLALLSAGCLTLSNDGHAICIDARLGPAHAGCGSSEPARHDAHVNEGVRVCEKLQVSLTRLPARTASHRCCGAPWLCPGGVPALQSIEVKPTVPYLNNSRLIRATVHRRGSRDHRPSARAAGYFHRAHPSRCAWWASLADALLDNNLEE